MSATVIATPQTIRQLKDVPASFRLGALVLLQTESGALTFVLPGGTRLVFRNEQPGAEAQIHVHDFRFIKRALAGGDVAFAESYMDGDWSTPDLTKVLQFFSANFDAASRLARGNLFVRSANMLRHVLGRRNSRSGALGRSAQYHGAL